MSIIGFVQSSLDNNHIYTFHTWSEHGGFALKPSRLASNGLASEEIQQSTRRLICLLTDFVL